MSHKNGYRFTSLVVVMILLTGILPVQAEALTSPLYASGDFLWAKSMGGVSGDGATSFVMDSSDNIYLTGYFQDTVDFDPSVGIDNLTSVGLTDIFISKLDSSGNYIWAKSMGGVSNDSAISIALDADGNIYLTGSFQGTADFDPGIGIYNLTSAGLNDTFIAKLNSSGNFLWAKQIGGTGSDNARSITVSSGNVVYISGVFQLTADFDPGAGISNLTSAGGFDIYISKLDSSGNLVWVKQIGGTANDLGRSKADASGNVYTIGEFQGTVDFDPGTSTFNLTSAGLEDVFVSKLDGDGNFLWAIREGGVGEDYGTSITPSANGDIYTTRTSYPQDLFIEKLDSNGNLVWEKTIHTTVEIYGTKIIQDPIGNIYAIGDFAGSADFDPGVGVFNMTSANDFWFDIFVIKLDSTGGFVWAKSVGGTGDESSRDITLDSGGYVYTTGRFEGTVDFDPGAGTFDLTSAGGSDIFISKLENVVAPVVISVVRADPNPTNATSVNFTVIFSKSVTGVNVGDFTLTTTGLTGASITSVSGSGTTYTVTVNTGSSNGTVRLDVVDDDSIQDGANNPLGGVNAGNGNFTTGEVYDVIKITNANLYIGTNNQGNYTLNPLDTIFKSFPNKVDGPVKVICQGGMPCFTTQVVTSGGSYNELAGYPVNQFTTEYWFPYYDHGYPNVAGNKMRTWILVGNPSDTETANVEIRIGGVLKNDPANPSNFFFSIPPGGNVTPRWLGLIGGPVQVKSTNGVNIFASERVFTVPYNSFNEVMGYPANQFTTEYWFPWYDTTYMDTYLLVGNTSTTQTAMVDIYLGTTKYGPYDILPNTTLKQRYANKVTGPVRVIATNGVNIVTSEFTLSGTENSFNEVMGYPFDQFDTEYWFPWYDHGYPSVGGNKMRTWILVGNPSSSQTATVQIYIDGVLKNDPANPSNYYFSIPPGGNVTPRWMGSIAGPVRVVSDIPIFSSERVFTVPTNAFNEFMGIPFSQFATEYWFTWYDTVYMQTKVLISKP